MSGLNKKLCFARNSSKRSTGLVLGMRSQGIQYSRRSEPLFPIQCLDRSVARGGSRIQCPIGLVIGTRRFPNSRCEILRGKSGGDKSQAPQEQTAKGACRVSSRAKNGAQTNRY